MLALMKVPRVALRLCQQCWTPKSVAAADPKCWFKQQLLTGTISGNFFELPLDIITNPIHCKMFSFVLEVINSSVLNGCKCSILVK